MIDHATQKGVVCSMLDARYARLSNPAFERNREGCVLDGRGVQKYF